jgi:hypothetical protein
VAQAAGVVNPVAAQPKVGVGRLEVLKTKASSGARAAVAPKVVRAPHPAAVPVVRADPQEQLAGRPGVPQVVRRVPQAVLKVAVGKPVVRPAACQALKAVPAVRKVAEPKVVAPAVRRVAEPKAVDLRMQEVRAAAGRRARAVKQAAVRVAADR